MRIAMISPLMESVPPRLYGGTERVIHNLVQGLVSAGHDVTLFASGDSVTAGHLVSVVPEAFRLSKQPIADPVAHTFRMMAMVAARAHRFDVIHNHHDYWMLPLSEMTETPLVTTLHGRLDLQDIPAAFMSFPKAKFISISDSQRGPLKLLPWLRTIYHGMDLENYKFSPRAGKYLAFLGRIFPEKGPSRAIRIAREAGIPLKIAAKIEGPESQAYFDAHIRPYIDGKSVEYIGEISEHEKSDFLGNALGLTFPIDWPEPFGLVMTEALACGTPVLARPCGSVPEILRDGITGWSSMDDSVLAKRAQDLESIDRAGCRRWVEDFFSLSRMTEAYIDVYRTLSDARILGITSRHRRDFLYPVERSAL